MRRIVRRIVLGDLRRELIRLRHRDPNNQLLEVIACRSEIGRQLLKELWLRRRIVRAEIVDRLRKSISEEVRPHAIDYGLVQKRTFHHKLAQLIAPVHLTNVTALADLGSIDKCWIRNLGQTIPQLVVNLCLFWPATFASKILVYDLDMVYIAVGRTSNVSSKCPRLSKERIELPKFLLLPLIEWMVVTLCALHLQTKKNAGHCCRRLSCILFIDLHRQEIRRTIKTLCTRFGRACRGNKLHHHFVIRFVEGKAVPKIFLHARTIGQASILHTAIATDKDVCPNR